MRARLQAVAVGFALLGVASCGGSGGGGGSSPPPPPPPPAYVPPFTLSFAASSGRLAIPDGPVRRSVSSVSAFVTPRPVAADGTFGPLDVTEGTGGLFLAFLDANGEPVLPAFVEGDPIVVGLDEVAAGLLAFTDWGVSVGRQGMADYLSLVRSCPGYPLARTLLSDALASSDPLLDGAAHGALFEALGHCAAEAFDAWATAGAAVEAQAARTSRGLAASAPCDPLDTAVEQVTLRQGTTNGRCSVYAVNPSSVFYGLEVASARGASDFRTMLLPARSGLFDLNWFSEGFQWNPGLLRPTPPSTRDVFPVGTPSSPGNYEARAYKRKAWGGGSRAAELASAANTIFGCVIVMDLALRIHSNDPVLGAVSDILERLAGDPEEFVALIDEVQAAEQDGTPEDGALAVLERLLVEDDAAPQSPEGRLEKLLDDFVHSPLHPSTIAKYLYKKNGIGLYEDWSSAMKAGWKIHKAWKSALRVLEIAGTANRALPYFWDLLFRPDVVSLCFAIQEDDRLTTPDLSCRTFSVVPVFSAMPRVPAPGDTVTFDASKTVHDGTRALTFSWDFDLDDGDTSLTVPSAAPVATHAYPVAGTYRVLLRVVREGEPGESHDLVRTIAVLPTELDFRAALAVPVGAGPTELVAADLDGDDDADAAVAIGGSGYLAILRNAGRGVLTLERLIALGASPGPLAVGDIDGDRDLDVAVSLGGGATLALLRNDGNLQFSRQADVVLPVGTAIAGLRLADLDGDTRPDLVVADSAHHEVVVWRSDGTFAFGDPAASLHRAYAVDTRPVDVVCADLDGDKDLDLVSANFTGDTLSVFEGDGAGGFSVRQLRLPGGFSTYGGPQWLAVGDVLPGGDPEVVVVNARANSVALFRRKVGAPTLELEAVGPDWVVEESLGRIRIADVDHDGFADLVRVREGANDVVVHFLDGTWSDPGSRPSTAVATDGGPRGLAVVDLNGDLQMDIVVANTGSDDVSVTLAAPGRTFDVRTDLRTRDDLVSDEPYDVVAGRLYTDEFEPAAPRTHAGLDLAVVTRLTARLVLFRNRDGRGDFRREQVLATGSEPLDVATGNLDGDPEPELVVACNHGSCVSLFDRGPDGRYALVENVTVDQEPLRVEIADVDGVGLPEVVVVHYNPSRVTVLRANLGGSPALQPIVSGVGGAVALAHDLSSGSLDGDGRSDFVASNYFAGTVSVLFGKADGSLEIGATMPGSLVTPLAVHVGSVDGTGDADADVLVSHAGGIAIFPGTGSRTFGTPINVETGIVGTNQSNDVLLSDVNRDGHPDLLVQDSEEFSVSGIPNRAAVHVLYGDGRRGFPRHVLFLTGPGPLALIAADVTGDGRDDVITCGHHADSSGYSRSVSVLRHR